MQITKTFALVLGTIVALQGGQASAFDTKALAETIAMAPMAPLNLIDWKVGDTMAYSVKMGMFGNIGTSTKTVTSDEGTAIWLRQQMNLMIQNQTVDILLNKADGKVLKMIQDGREVAVPNDPIEVISQDATSVTVPAGTFDVIHIVAKSAQISKIELWANPRDTAMDGGVKQAMTTQFGEIVMELTSFTRN